MTPFSTGSELAGNRISELVAAGDCDLHLHTHNSDGSDSASGLVDRVLAAGLRAFAITDHDTLSGIAAARQALETCLSERDETNLPLLVPGVEISVDDGIELHLLGYFPFGGESTLEPFLAEQRRRRSTRNEAMLERLASLGYPIDPQAFAASGEEVLGRMQVALLLVEHGYFASVADAFAQLLREGKPGYMARPRPGIAEAIAAIRSAGGATVLAHPALYGWCTDAPFIAPELIERLQRYRALGLQGVEAFHGEATPEQQAQVEAAAHVCGLTATCGSDDHGKHKQHAHLYTRGMRFGTPDIIVVTAALVSGTTASGEAGLLMNRRAGARSSVGLWEYPGGKLEPNETPEACLARELHEELSVRALVGSLTVALHHDYGRVRVVLLCYEATLLDDPVLDPRIHDDMRFLTFAEARLIGILPADLHVIDRLEQLAQDRQRQAQAEAAQQARDRLFMDRVQRGFKSQTG